MNAAPNVLVFMCDQLNASVLGCYGGQAILPNIDRLAGEGVRFTNAMCPTPFCSPSRASCITGMYPHAHGIVTNVNRRDYPTEPTPETEEGIKAGDVTTDGLLAEAGYVTHHYGKWHLMDDDLPYYPDMYREHDAYEREMAARFAEVRRGDSADYMEWYGWALPVDVAPCVREAVARALPSWPNPMYGEFAGKMGRLRFAPEETFDYRVAEKTIAAIENVGDAPFSITCSFNGPHDPHVVPSPYYESIDPAGIELPANYEACEARFEDMWSRQLARDIGEDGVREFLRIYFANMHLIDEQIGRVMAALEASGRAEDTIVVFTADHGDMAGGHGMIWKSVTAFYDDVARVPLLVRYFAGFGPAVCDIPVNLTDMMPTLLALTGHAVPSGVQGTDLSPYLLGLRDAAEAPAVTFCERIAGNPQRTRRIDPRADGAFMARSRRAKYMRYPDGEEFLYNLADDPGETRNRMDDPACASIKEELRSALAQWKDDTNCPLRA